MYFIVYIFFIEFVIQLLIGKYENVLYSFYSFFFSLMELFVWIEVCYIININIQYYKDSNKYEDKQIFYLYNFNFISNEIMFNVKCIVIKLLVNNIWEILLI